MDCLTIGMALAILLLVGFSVLGLALETPAMTWVFGYLALIGSVPLLWLSLSKPVGERYGARGIQVFNRVLVSAALVELALPVVVFFVSGVVAADSNPAITMPLVLFFNVVALALYGIWWRARSR